MAEPLQVVMLAQQSPVVRIFPVEGQTIVALYFKPGRPTFKMDEIIEVKGIFTLNQDDVNLLQLYTQRS